MRRLLRHLPVVALFLAMVEEAEHIETVIANAAAAYGLTTREEPHV